MMTYTVDKVLLDDLKEIERVIHTNEHTSVQARWRSGRKILLFYDVGKKQLRKGTLDAIAAELGVVRSEVGARIKFARKYPTEHEVSTAVETFKSWSAIRQQALTDTPRRTASKAPNPPLYRAFALVENIDAETLTENDIRFIEHFVEHLHRLETSIVTLRAA